MEKIDITSELERFDAHLKNNERTILSARFGDGKSYFLNEYYARHQIWKDYTPVDDRVGSAEDTYFVVLHPVNYVVAKNEDVFEYVKRDILVQLYVEGKIDKIDYKALLKSVCNTLKEKALPMLGEMAALLPGGEIAKLYVEFGAAVKEKYDEEKKTASDFIDGFVKQKGGIYEKDAYTELICETLKHLNRPKDMKPARKILVIEDLDRLDPGHLFRILNVLGAHIDEKGGGNKFGFDNIVLVMDYDVTRHLFEHFYGTGANYEGYMNKFISNNLFHYSIKSVAQQQLITKITELAGDNILNVLVNGSQYLTRHVSVRSLILQLSVRKIEHILDNLESMIPQAYIETNGLKLCTKNPLTYLLALLTLVDESYELQSIIESLDRDDWLEFVGALVYAEERVQFYPIKSERGLMYNVESTADKDGIITSVSLNPSMVVNPEFTSERADVIRKAIELAKKVVRDAQGLKFVISLGNNT